MVPMKQPGASIRAQTNVVEKLLESIRTNARGAHFVEGRSGVGKSWIASQLRDTFVKDDKWRVFYFSCPEWASNQPYSPLELGLLKASSEGFASAGARLASNAAKDIPFVGNTASAAFTGLLALSKRKRLDLGDLLPATAQEICFKLQKEIGDRSALIVFDDAHWMDEGTRTLIRAFFEMELAQVFPFLRRTHVVAIATPEQTDVDAIELAMGLGMSHFHTHTVHECSELEFIEVLEHFGLERKLGSDRLRDLYAITGGHLKIAKHVVDLLNSDGSPDMLSGSDSKKIFQIAIEHKLNSLGPLGAELQKLLGKAVTIGSNFSVDELSCLLNLDLTTVRYKLDEAERCLLIHRTGHQVSFAHSIVREYFEKTVSPPVSKSDHEKFAECLKLIRPGHYGLRAAHLGRAGLNREAAALSICDALARFRNGITSPWDTASRQVDELSPDLVPLIDLLRTAYEHFERGEYHETSELCAEISIAAPAIVSAEVAILRGRALTKMSNFYGREHSVMVLSDALNEIDEAEVELWARVVLYLVVAEAFAGNLEAARKAGKRLCQVLERRLNFDPLSQMLLNRFRLRADLFFSEDLAAGEIKKVLRDLIPIDGIPTEPTQAFIALNNAAGNALYRGEFEQALRFCTQADELLNVFDSLNFPRLDILGNNQLLTTWLSGKLTSSAFARQAEILLGATTPNNDTSILRSNFAFALIQSGQLDEALKLLKSAYATVNSAEHTDYFDRYFLGNNLAGCLFELGKADEAFLIWEELSDLPGKLPYAIRDFMALRHATQDEIFYHQAGLAWDNFSREKLKDRIGTMWRFFGRGFLLSELQFWSDD
jgi:tetratricopeptide (TPR) repeat protein